MPDLSDSLVLSPLPHGGSHILLHTYYWVPCISDFSNFIVKPSIRAIAEADDHEVVREVQVIREF